MYENLSLNNYSNLKLVDYKNFNEKFFINRNDVKEFEQDLKSDFIDKIQDVNQSNFVKNLKLNSSFEQTSFDFEQHLPILVEYLNENDMLPCLAFCFDQYRCEKYARILFDYFEQKEDHLRETKYKSILEELELKRDIEMSMKKIKR